MIPSSDQVLHIECKKTLFHIAKRNYALLHFSKRKELDFYLKQQIFHDRTRREMGG